jgi:transmembrane sensor
VTEASNGSSEHARAEAASWCMKLASGSASLEEQLEFEVWLDRAAGNRATFTRVVALWDGAEYVADTPEMIAARADALEAMRGANARRWSRTLWTRLRPALATAACVALLLLSTFLVQGDRGDAFSTGVGERRVVRLQDGSKLSLDAATTVEVTYSDDKRTLRLLRGRAKFDVAKDPRRPFSVLAGGKLVVATGTAFSVELLRFQMRVILYEGRVAILQNGPSNAPPRPVQLFRTGTNADAALKPGTELVARLSANDAKVVDTDATRSLSWEGGQLTFTDEPLGLAVERLNRYSDVKVQLEDADTARLLISGAFNAGDTEGFVDGVSAVFPVKAHRAGQVITLGPKAAPR